MPKPVCVKCHRFFKPKQCGVRIIEGMPMGQATRPGLDHDHLWKDYKLWSCDLYECAGCGTEIFVGFANQPIREHYMPDFAEEKNRLGASFRVNDC